MSEVRFDRDERGSASALSARWMSSRGRLLFWVAVSCLLGVLAAEEWLSIRHLSITVDEGAHTYAGYEHWTAKDFGVNPEHPPLVKLVAAAPLLGLHLRQPHPPPINFLVEEYAGGSQLFDENDGEQVLRRARTAASVFTFLLGLLVLAAGYEMYGPAVGLLALTLFVFEPTVLAHGALVTTDMGAASFLFAAFYAFYRFLKRPTWLRLLLCGAAVGLALAAKMSGVLAVPILVGLAAVDLLVSRVDRPKRAGRLLGALLAIVLVGYGVLWSFYRFRYAARPGGLVLTPSLAQMAHTLPRPFETGVILRLAAWHLFPEAYLYGWAKLLGNVTGLPAFLFGRIYPHGTWMYFPAALLIKSTLGLLLLLVASAFVLKRLGRKTYLPSVGLAIALVAILLFCLPSPLNIGVRHALPMYPFAVVLAGAGAWALARESQAGAVAVTLLLLWQGVSSLHSYPDYLPYSNEAFGGPSKTYRVLADSNVDWGQQVGEVSAYLRAHNIRDCWFAYSNMSFAPEKLPCRALPTGLALIAGQPEPPVPPHLHGTVLVSALDASGALWGPGDLNPYRQFQEGRPAEMIGNSVLVYRGDFDVPLVAAEAHLSRVPLLLRMHRADAALAEANAALSLAPDAPMMEVAMGGTLLQLGRGEEAQRAFSRAIEEAAASTTPGETQAVATRIDQLKRPLFQ